VKVNLYDNTRKKNIEGVISKAHKKELPKANWKFDWKSLHAKNSKIFKLEYEGEIQGLLKMTQVDEGYYLAFTSKGELIPHYEKYYYAELVYREKMIIFPRNGKKLIRKFLNLKI